MVKSRVLQKKKKRGKEREREKKWLLTLKKVRRPASYRSAGQRFLLAGSSANPPTPFPSHLLVALAHFQRTRIYANAALTAGAAFSKAFEACDLSVSVARRRTGLSGLSLPSATFPRDCEQETIFGIIRVTRTRGSDTNKVVVVVGEG